MAVAPSVIRTLESGNELHEPSLAPLFKDPEEDNNSL